MPHDDDFIPEHPRFRLTALPSPLERAERLEGALGGDATSVPRIYLKRDDLLSLAMGGNKIRNLEFVIGAALAAGTTDVITAGRQQSNHCRLTAAACVRAGLQAHLVLSGARPARFTGNLLLDDLFGAAIHFTGSDDREARAATIAQTAQRLSADGRRPFLIPVGGSDAVGALGHVLAAREIVQQCDSMGERPTAIVLATAT
ncbi:MAG TPA: pyridoxal-phosphate dependent enzyme, partial [Dehalococcoidia bacterium]